MDHGRERVPHHEGRVTLVETDTRYRVSFYVWKCRCGKRAVTTNPFAKAPTCCTRAAP